MALKLSRELKEKVSHGSRLFPMAGYLWHGGESAERVRVHWHPEIELIRLVKGRMQLQINLEEMTIEGPALVILPANLLHGLLLTEDCYQEALLLTPRPLPCPPLTRWKTRSCPPLPRGRWPRDRSSCLLRACLRSSMRCLRMP